MYKNSLSLYFFEKRIDLTRNYSGHSYGVLLWVKLFIEYIIKGKLRIHKTTMECIMLPLRQNLSQGQAGLSSAGMYGALNFYSFMWGFEVSVSMHVGVGRQLSGVSCHCGSGCWVLGVALGFSLVQAALPLSHLNGYRMDIYLKLV